MKPALRNIFAALGLCDSTADLARKPRLVQQIVDHSLPHVNWVDDGYADRLRGHLDAAYTLTLDRLVANNVIVCLDKRMSRLDSDPWDARVDAAYYNTDGRRIVSLPDTGMRDAPDISKTAINGPLDAIATKMCTGNAPLPSIMIGEDVGRAVVFCGLGESFVWRDARHFAGLMDRNPALKRPPVRPLPSSGPGSSGPPVPGGR
jgi:hypothetical protein